MAIGLHILGGLVGNGRFLGGIEIRQGIGDAREQGQLLPGSKIIGLLGFARQQYHVFQQSGPSKSKQYA